MLTSTEVRDSISSFQQVFSVKPGGVTVSADGQEVKRASVYAVVQPWARWSWGHPVCVWVCVPSAWCVRVSVVCPWCGA